MNKKAEDEFDRQAASLLGETLSLALVAVVMLGVGWAVGVILAQL